MCVYGFYFCSITVKLSPNLAVSWNISTVWLRKVLGLVELSITSICITVFLRIEGLRKQKWITSGVPKILFLFLFLNCLNLFRLIASTNFIFHSMFSLCPPKSTIQMTLRENDYFFEIGNPFHFISSNLYCLNFKCILIIVDHPLEVILVCILFAPKRYFNCQSCTDSHYLNQLTLLKF